MTDSTARGGLGYKIPFAVLNSRLIEDLLCSSGMAGTLALYQAVLQTDVDISRGHIWVQRMLQREGNEIAQLKGSAASSAVVVALGRQEKCRSVGTQPLIWGMYMKSCELQLTQSCYCAVNCLVFLHCHFLNKTLKVKVCKAGSSCSWPLAVPEGEFAGTGKIEFCRGSS